MPTLPGELNVCVLAFFRATTEKDDQDCSILPQINAVAWAEIDPVFRDTLPDRL